MNDRCGGKMDGGFEGVVLLVLKLWVWYSFLYL